MIIIIIIFAKGINHGHVRVRAGQGAGREQAEERAEEQAS